MSWTSRVQYVSMTSNSSREKFDRPPLPDLITSGIGPIMSSYALINEHIKNEKISKICSVIFAVLFVLALYPGRYFVTLKYFPRAKVMTNVSPLSRLTLTHPCECSRARVIGARVLQIMFASYENANPI